jgi:MEMO1 family protein
MIREPAVAGTFYTDQPGALRQEVESFLTRPDLRPDPGVIGIVSPHAGYLYSGAVAGAAFASAPDSIRTVVVVAPPHRVPVSGFSAFDGEGFRTPLGVAPAAREVIHRLLASGCVFQPMPHAKEHSAEVQLPFIQVRWPGASIAIVLQGDGSSAAARKLAGMIHLAVGIQAEGCLVVASSDLSHYHPLRTAGELDGAVIDAWLGGSPERLDQVIRSGRGEACGAGPMLTLLHYAALRGARTFRKLSYDTSATASGDASAVVGYFAGTAGFEGGRA